MKWTMRYAALLAALVLALGLVEMTRPVAAAADSDEVMLGRPPQKGDPDSGGTSRFVTSRWTGWSGSWARTVSSLLPSLVPRRPVDNHATLGSQTAQSRAARR